MNRTMTEGSRFEPTPQTTNGMVSGMLERKAQKPDFDTVVREHAEALKAYLQRMVRNETDADDLLQETLIKIARGLPGFEGRSTVKSWCFRIAHRNALDHFRRADNARGIVEFDEEKLPANELDEDGPIVIDEMNSCVRDVIDSLPPTYRTAIILHDLQKLTAQECADAMDCTRANAKIRIHRARKRLREALANSCSFYRTRGQVLRCDRKDGDESPA